jgi:cell wall-associated NlpC family hydrolase
VDSRERGKVHLRSVHCSGAQLRPGAHLVSPRLGYSHHGIYVGNGLVVHHGGFERGLRIGPVEVISIERFARGRQLRVLEEGAPHFDAAEIAQRAMSRIGEDSYRILTNNCEHFCEWCVHAEVRSYQVDCLMHLMTAPLRFLRGVRDCSALLRVFLASALSYLFSSRGFNP